jgi:hypothetical protein
MKTKIKAYSPALQKPSRPALSSAVECSQPKKANRHTSSLLRSLLIASCLQFPVLCHALDVDPGDYTPMPEGTKLGLLYLQHAERDEFYLDDDKVSDKYKLDSDVAILRGVRYQNIGGHLTNIQLLLPFGHLSAGGDIDALGSESGMGDPILANAIWINKEPSLSRSLAITQYLFLPFGEYDKDNLLNLGENRWKYVFQGGYMHGFSDNIVIDLVADVTFFGDNDDYTAADLTLEQDPQYQLQGFLRYKVGEKAALHVGYSRLWGGETEVDGVRLGDESNQEKMLAGGSYFVTPQTQVLATFGRDVSVESGFKEESRLNLRLLHVF